MPATAATAGPPAPPARPRAGPPAGRFGAASAAGQPGGFADQGIWPCGGQLADELLADDAAGFSQDGVLGGLCAGPELALLLPGADDLAGLDDEQLTGVVRGW